MIPSLVEGLLLGFLSPVEQNHSLATKFPARKPSDGKLNLTWSSDKIWNFCNAQVDPYPGAYFYFDNKKWRVRTCEKSGLAGKRFKPKTINFLNDRVVAISCGDGQVLKASVEPYEL